MAGKNEQLIDIAELDCIYLSYDEPQKEEFWAKISAMVPWAKRVDGVKGSDAAHKAAAAAATRCVCARGILGSLGYFVVLGLRCPRRQRHRDNA